MHEVRGRGPLEAAAISQLALMGVLLRAAVGGLLALTYLVANEHSAGGWIIYGIVGTWAVVRFLTFRANGWLTTLDAAVLLGFLVAEPAVAGLTGPVDHASGQLVLPLLLSFTLPLSAWISFPIVAGLIAAKSLSAATEGGASGSELSIFAVSVAFLWAVTAGIRLVILRVSRASDDAKAAADNADLSGVIMGARRRFAREQWALLHDTAASTLLMVSQGAVTNRDRLTAQAQRDLRAIAEFSPERDGAAQVRLRDVLDEVCREFALPIDLNCPEGLHLPAYVARAVAAATREALTNVERHASATSVSVDAAPSSVTITDDGVGFSAGEQQLAEHFGVRNSIIGRMRRIGGEATVRRGPESGSVVELTWHADDDGAAPVRNPLVLPVRVASTFNLGIVVIGAVVAIANFVSSLLADTAPPTTLQLVLFGILCAISVVAVVLAYFPNKPVSVAASAVLVVLGPAFVLTIPPSAVLDVHNWPLVSTAWTLTALLFRFRLLISYSALAALWVVELGVIIAVAPTQDTLVGVGHVLIASTVTQFTALIVLGFVARTAARLRRDADEKRALSDLESVRDALAADHAERRLKLSETVIPLLTGFAESTLDPSDPQVRARAGVEASRLRRMVALGDVSEYTLASELQPALDRAEDRGVEVSADIAPVLPPMPVDRLQLLADAVGVLLAASATTVRLVVMSIDGLLVLSVVGDGIDSATVGALQLPPGFAVTSMGNGPLTWVQMRELAPEAHSAESLAN